MTVKQYEATKAYVSIADLNKQKLSSGKLAKKIYDLTQKLKSAYDFQLQEEQKICEAYPDFDPQVNGIPMTGKTDEERKQIMEDLKKINQEIKEVSELDVEIDVEPFTIDLDRFPNLQISGEDIGNLEKFITFK